MSDLDERVRRLQRLTDPERNRGRDERRRVLRGMFERLAVVLRFAEAVPDERADAVTAAVTPHHMALIRPHEGETLAAAPAVVRLLRAVGDPLRVFRFPDPIPTAWLDQYLDHPAAEEVVTVGCERCGLPHPSYANHTLPADWAYTRPDGTAAVIPKGSYYQSFPVCPNWRCVVCGGRVACPYRQLGGPSLGEALLSRGGRLRWRRSKRTGEKHPFLVRPVPDPIDQFEIPDTLELAR